MPVQSADDQGRELDGIWLGPPGSWRWPVDWSFKKWALFAVASLLSLAAMIFIVPFGVILAVCAYQGARWMAPTFNADAPRTWRRILFGALLFVLATVVHSPRVWVLPVFAPLAFLLAPLIGALAVRLYGRFLTWNTPMGYYLRMPRLVAGGPRPLGARTIDPNALALEGGDTNRSLTPTTAVIRPSQPVRVSPALAPPVRRSTGQQEPPMAMGIDVASDFVTLAHAVVAPSGATHYEVTTYPMPPKRHPFVVRIPGGLYFHRLNYKIEWGPR